MGLFSLFFNNADDDDVSFEALENDADACVDENPTDPPWASDNTPLFDLFSIKVDEPSDLAVVENPIISDMPLFFDTDNGGLPLSLHSTDKKINTAALTDPQLPQLNIPTLLGNFTLVGTSSEKALKLEQDKHLGNTCLEGVQTIVNNSAKNEVAISSGITSEKGSFLGINGSHVNAKKADAPDVTSLSIQGHDNTGNRINASGSTSKTPIATTNTVAANVSLEGILATVKNTQTDGPKPEETTQLNASGTGGVQLNANKTHRPGIETQALSATVKPLGSPNQLTVANNATTTTTGATDLTAVTFKSPTSTLTASHQETTLGNATSSTSTVNRAVGTTNLTQSVTAEGLQTTTATINNAAEGLTSTTSIGTQDNATSVNAAIKVQKPGSPNRFESTFTGEKSNDFNFNGSFNRVSGANTLAITASAQNTLHGRTGPQSTASVGVAATTQVSPELKASGSVGGLFNENSGSVFANSAVSFTGDKLKMASTTAVNATPDAAAINQTLTGSYKSDHLNGSLNANLTAATGALPNFSGNANVTYKAGTTALSFNATGTSTQGQTTFSGNFNAQHKVGKATHKLGMLYTNPAEGPETFSLTDQWRFPVHKQGSLLLRGAMNFVEGKNPTGNIFTGVFANACKCAVGVNTDVTTWPPKPPTFTILRNVL